MSRAVRPLALLAIVSVILSGCMVLKLTPGQFQSLVLYFKLSQPAVDGQRTSAYVAVYPSEVMIRNRWIKISGTLKSSLAGILPDAIQVEVVSRNGDTNTVFNRFTQRVDIDNDGSFSEIKKFTRNLPAGTIQEFFIIPMGSNLLVDTEVQLCVDMFQKRTHARRSDDCGDGGGAPPPPSGDVVTVQVGDNFFNPQRVTIQPGQTVRWVLTGNLPNHTTTAMVSADWDSGFVFLSDGSFFERTFPASENGRTFQYRCLTHEGGGMKGSVLVGNSAPDPGDGY